MRPSGTRRLVVGSVAVQDKLAGLVGEEDGGVRQVNAELAPGSNRSG
jgi:hypothetical protein